MGLEKNTTGQKWVVFAFDTTTGTAKTGDAANITANLRIDGGAANAVDDVNPSELEDGYYAFDLTQAETNGDMILIAPASSTSNIQVIGVPGVVHTTAPNFNALGIETDGDLTKVNTLNGHTAQTGDSYARLGAPSGASVSADIASIEAIKGATWSAATDTLEHIRNKQTDIETDTAEIGVAGAGLTAVPFNSAWESEIQGDVNDALYAYDPPTRTEMAVEFDTIKGATWNSSTDTLEAIRDRGDAAWTTGAGGTPPDLLQSTDIATLASQTSFTLTAGSADDDAYNDQIAIITDSATSTQKAVATISDYTGSTKTVTLSADPGIFTIAVGDTIEIVAATGAAGSGATASEVWGYATRTLSANTNLNDPTAAAIADAVWDEAQADHVGAGSMGLVASEVADILTDTGTTLPTTLSTIEGKVDTVDTNVDAVLVDTGTTLPGTLTTIEGKIDTVDTNVDAVLVDTGTTLPGTLATIDSIVDAILVDTGELQGDWTNGGRLDLILDQILADTGTDGVQISAATANEIADALLKRDFSAVSGEAARSALNALRFLRNKWSISGTTLTVTEEDDTTSAWTATVSVDATADPVVGNDPA